MTDQRIKAQMIQTAFVWGFSLCMILGLISVAGSIMPEGLTALAELKGALAH